jgi:enamine deaminase RidA (YjgF/YER057c/UK114 family)
MVCKIGNKLKDIGVELPIISKPAANYLPYTKIKKDKIVVSGQLPMTDGKVKYIGKLGKEMTLEEGQDAARLCALNIIAQLNDNCEGNLDKIVRCIKLDIFINCTEDFTEHSEVADGASNLMIELFGEKGKHARIAVGVNQLPKGAAVEVGGFFAIED